MNVRALQPVSKLPQVGTTIFTTMSKMAADFNAINLSQGFPDFEPPKALLDALRARLSGGHHQYPPMAGVLSLREAIANKVARHYGAEVNPETEVTVTSGATEAIFVAIQAVVEQGDEVIMFDPAYDAYDPAVRLAGGIPVHISLEAPDFQIDIEKVAKALSARTKLIILNSPHNPTGQVISSGTLQALKVLVLSARCYLLSDEVYEHMVFDGARHESLLRDEALRARSFVISSFGKTYHATGWKVAYCVAPPELTVEFRKVHQFVTFTTHTPTQWAIADFMTEHPEHEEELSLFYQSKRDVFLEAFSALPFSMTASAGTYFQLADYGEVSGLSHLSDVACAERLTQDFGVAVIPISVFYERPPSGQTLIRFCFAKSETLLREAAGRLSQLRRV